MPPASPPRPAGGKPYHWVDGFGAVAPAPEPFEHRRFAFRGLLAYIERMPSKPIELPPAVAKAFVADIHAYFKEKNQIRQHEIAARQLHALRQHQGPRDKKLRLSDVTQMFVQMKDHA